MAETRFDFRFPIRVKIRFYSKEELGREISRYGDPAGVYRGVTMRDVDKRGVGFSSFFEYPNDDGFRGGSEYITRMNVIAINDAQEYGPVGQKFKIWEGGDIGEGEVLGFEQLKYEDVNQAILDTFPQIADEIEDNMDLPYVVAGRVSDFILKCYQSDDKHMYSYALNIIEKLHLQKDQMVRELATIGYLESIQNTWPAELLKKKIPFKDLGPESKKCWIALNEFWNPSKKSFFKRLFKK